MSSKFQKTKYDLDYLLTISNIKNKLLMIIVYVLKIFFSTDGKN